MSPPLSKLETNIILNPSYTSPKFETYGEIPIKDYHERQASAIRQLNYTSPLRFKPLRMSDS